MNKSEIRIACQSDANVLITGPTGAGKTRLARELHEGGKRGKRPFVTVNLASLHEGTIESELFGHERGAFTGADQRRVGRLEAANGGTVFLDEIGELSLRLQARLLEFLQTRVISPVGSNRQTALDVRVIAATHRDLGRAAAAGSFREDLFHRLRVVTIRLPSLVDRPEDFDSILHSCLEDVSKAYGRSILRLSEGVAHRLESYSWPGNIRELRNVLEYAVLSAEGVEITSNDLPSWFGEKDNGAQVPSQSDVALLATAEFPMTMDFHATLTCFEREYLKRALRRFQGRINRTAREIGMSKTTLIRRIRVHGINVDAP